MKALFILIFPLLIATRGISQNVSISNDGATPNPSAILDVKSTTKGFLPPRMTTAQRDVITNPEPGLMIFNTSTQNIEFYTTYGWSQMKKVVPLSNKLLGGKSIDGIGASCMLQTTDGGFIVAGTTSLFIGGYGDIPSPPAGHAFGEIWIIKFDAAGNILWNKLFGGAGNDDATSIKQTADGGYIICGSSNSSASGDITSTNHGSYDYLVLKLDASGNVTWNKLLGGSGQDQATSISLTSDGNYIIVGNSTSSANGDVTGTGRGNNDIWVVKLSSSGNIIWNRLFGGTGADVANAVRQTPDGGYIIVGNSLSSASVDVTPVNHGGTDCWIIKLDSGGNISWNKLLGGTGSEDATTVRPTPDAGFIIAGNSSSSANGDVTESNHGLNDVWILKLDALGNIIWNKLLGGADDEFARAIELTPDGGYVLPAQTFSSYNGNVTTQNHGGADYWLVKLDATGGITWNKAYGGSANDLAWAIIQTPDGGYVIAGTSASSMSGDVTGLNHGSNDWWIIRVDGSGNLL